MKKPNYTQRGDTLVEVLIAITIVGIVVAGVMSIMNRSYVSILNSAERTAVRAEINSQAELLWYIHDHDTTKWNTVVSKAHDASAGGVAAGTQLGLAETTCNKSNKSFYIDDNVVVQATSGSEERNAEGRAVVGNGIIIDAVERGYESGNVPYIDFYIKACWAPLGNMPDSESTTIVRIKK